MLDFGDGLHWDTEHEHPVYFGGLLSEYQFE